jgi:Protein of unknown function, DUF488
MLPRLRLQTHRGRPQTLVFQGSPLYIFAMAKIGSDFAAIEVLTIGHSSLAYGDFLRRLDMSGVTAIADVRSSPYSRRSPQFGKKELSDALRLSGIAYVFLGKELGGRPTNPKLFNYGIADYERMAAEPEFLEGLLRVAHGAQRYKIALMCSEASPFDCHRCLLVGRALHERGASVKHILSDDSLCSQNDIESSLLEMANKESGDLFQSRSERLWAAYRSRARKVAYSESGESDRQPHGAFTQWDM